MPAKVASRPSAMLTPTYKNAVAISPLRISETVSYEKAEYVVNPPNMPVAKNKRHSWLIVPFKLNANTKPIKKQPATFTTNVPYGKPDITLF